MDIRNLFSYQTLSEIFSTDIVESVKTINMSDFNTTAFNFRQLEIEEPEIVEKYCSYLNQYSFRRSLKFNLFNRWEWDDRAVSLIGEGEKITMYPSLDGSAIMINADIYILNENIDLIEFYCCFEK